jgi:hypothetical protein
MMMPVKKICDICDQPFLATTDTTNTCTSCLLRPSKIIFRKFSKPDELVLSGVKTGVVLPGAKKTGH